MIQTEDDIRVACRAGVDKFSPAWWQNGEARVSSQWGYLIEENAGVLLPSMVARRIWLETRGAPGAVSKIGEVGLLQLSKATRDQYGLSVKQAMDPAINLRYGCRLWRAWARSFAADTGAPWPPRGLDGWMESWLVTAIGPGAMRAIAEIDEKDLVKLCMEQPRKILDRHNFFGSQKPSLVAYRIGIADTALRTLGNATGIHPVAALGIGLAVLALT